MVADQELTDFSKFLRADGIITNLDGFCRAITELGLYWVFVTYAPEWDVVIARLLNETFGFARKAPDPVLYLEGKPEKFPDYGAIYMEHPIPSFFYIRKSCVSSRNIADRLGVTVDAVEASKAMMLKPTKEMQENHMEDHSNIPRELYNYTVH